MTYSSEVLADSPYLYWRLGEPSGTSAADASGNGRAGTYSGSPTMGVAGLLTGDSDTAVQFDASNDLVTWADSSNLTSFTFEGWYKGTDSGGTIAGRWDVAYGIAYLQLNGGKFQFVVSNAAGSLFASPTSVANGNDNVRHHVVGTYDGTTTRLYVDGIQVGTPSTTVSGAMRTEDVAFVVGGRKVTAELAGVIDEIAYYTTALSSARVMAHWLAGAPPTTGTAGGYTTVASTSPGGFSWTPPAGVTSYDALIVAGGGGGGTQGNGGGGGGAGGLIWLTGQSCTPGTPVTGSVGGGGAGATSGTLVPGTNGGDSVFGTSATVIGGGGGGAGSSGSAANNGKAGGSGGAGSGATAGNTATGGAGTSGQGSAGGSSYAVGSPVQSRAGGGGGGKGATGTTATAKTGGTGGAGYDASADLGTAVGASGWFAGGGGGGTNDKTSNGAVPGAGGSGGGGAGQNVPAAGPGIVAGAGTANTGGGGGGNSGDQSGTATAGFGGAGGSGVIVVRYAVAPGIPSFVFCTGTTTTTLELTWAAPTSGGTPTSYEVRLDFGTPTTATSPHTFTGLTPGTSYTLEVRAVNAAGELRLGDGARGHRRRPPRGPHVGSRNPYLDHGRPLMEQPEHGGPVHIV